MLVWPNAQIQVLDAEEFKINSDRFLYPEDLLKRVDETLAELIELARNSKLPV